MSEMHFKTVQEQGTVKGLKAKWQWHGDSVYDSINFGVSPYTDILENVPDRSYIQISVNA